MDYNSSKMIEDNRNGCTRICWTAIFSGALIGLGLAFLLQLYGVAISLSAYNASSNGAQTIAVGGLIGLLIGVLFSMGIAGFVSGYLGRMYSHCHDSVIYGFLTWTLALVLSALMVLPLTHYVAGYSHALASSATTSNASSHDSTASNSSANTEDNATQAKVRDALTGGSWVLFFLFFIGAISSCIGAYLGLRTKKSCHSNTSENVPPPM